MAGPPSIRISSARLTLPVMAGAAQVRTMARAAGVPSVLVTFGPSGDDMAALEPEALLHHFDDLPGLVPDLIGAAA